MYYLPAQTPEKDLALMRAIDEFTLSTRSSAHGSSPGSSPAKGIPTPVGCTSAR